MTAEITHRDDSDTDRDAVVMDGLAALEAERAVSTIPVHVSYEIIRLFSEGLYQSPHKAIEELVSNSYDAGAKHVHVLLPQAEVPDDDQAATGTEVPWQLPPLWVVDDGHGLDSDGFFQLWRVADSVKAAAPQDAERPPIGQFGIGKLAAYVLAWRLTHVSCVGGVIRSTTMNFRRLAGIHQYNNISPFGLELHEITTERAQEHLADIKDRDPKAWDLMFGEYPAESWTAAGLSDFKDLYDKLSAGRLQWVLSTGLPLHADFQIFLNKNEVKSSKENLEVLYLHECGGDDAVAEALTFKTTPTGVVIPGITGEVTGTAKIFKKKLTEGKSDQYSRSHGFFIRVRGRVINLDDQLFGLPALNHAAWSRFSMEITVDGLREHLLSSREGVRNSLATDAFRDYLRGVFNACRNAFDDWNEKQKHGIDLDHLLKDSPSAFLTEPLIDGVSRVVQDNEESFYIDLPEVEPSDRVEWLREYSQSVSQAPFSEFILEATGQFGRAVRYSPDNRALFINTDHPFIEKLLASGKTKAPVYLFGSSEVMVDLILQDHGLSRAAIIDFMADRDRVLRLVAGAEPSTAAEVLRLLQSANKHEFALERAVGLAFRVLGFEYERGGLNIPGADGILYARLGRGSGESLIDYKVVYDSKQTNQPAVPADKINIDSIRDFLKKESADFAFFIAVAFAGQERDDSKLGRAIIEAKETGRPVSLLVIDHLRRLVELHYQHGITLTRLRSLFKEAHTVSEVTRWIDNLERELSEQDERVPLMRLLEGLEEAKADHLAIPNVHTARALDSELKAFTPERLIAALQAVATIVGSRWIEVETGGNIRLHHTAQQIIAEVERHLRGLLGVDAMERRPVK
ncbi:ATP-binding protein [Micromonospora sp. NPDC050795]|uniref:ATP-binding protein n=1 Tax=Micromonospora sp. NPDC050795 TaxID=3364282 RepID=UPI0037ACF87A